MTRPNTSAIRMIAPTMIAGERHEARVLVPDVADLVADDALEFVAVQVHQQAGGHGDDGVLRRADGEGVGRVGVDDVDARHLRQAGGDGHFLDDVEQAGGVGLLDFARVGAGEEDVVAAGDRDDPDARSRRRARSWRRAKPAPVIEAVGFPAGAS